MTKPCGRPKQIGAVKTLVRVTLNDSFQIRPRTEDSSLLIVQLAATIQSPEPRVDNINIRILIMEFESISRPSPQKSVHWTNLFRMRPTLVDLAILRRRCSGNDGDGRGD